MQRLFIFISVAIIFFSCSQRPEHVLSEDKMVDVMTDIHKSEAYWNSRPGQVILDSAKKVMRQSILLKHNVTQAQFDSTLAWYGRNIDEYTETYDKIIKNLQSQLIASQQRAKDSGEDGSSVFGGENMWGKSPLQIIKYGSDRDNISFIKNVAGDIDKGDRILWECRVTNSNSLMYMYLATMYDSGEVTFVNKTITNDGKHQLTLQTDSQLNIKEIYCYIRSVPKKGEVVYVDSIMLIKEPLKAGYYHQIYSQRKFKYKEVKSKNDTTLTDSIK